MIKCRKDSSQPVLVEPCPLSQVSAVDFMALSWNIAAHPKRYISRYLSSIPALTRFHTELPVYHFESFLQFGSWGFLLLKKLAGHSLSYCGFRHPVCLIQTSDTILLYVVCSLQMRMHKNRIMARTSKRDHFPKSLAFSIVLDHL
ncbi:hypothetical protein TNCV_606441 [Trichonephila clavipes]|nr:hypothetical protein TNCV_606441 [Trichonephila clavipes]